MQNYNSSYLSQKTENSSEVFFFTLQSFESRAMISSGLIVLNTISLLMTINLISCNLHCFPEIVCQFTSFL